MNVVRRVCCIIPLKFPKLFQQTTYHSSIVRFEKDAVYSIKQKMEETFCQLYVTLSRNSLIFEKTECSEKENLLTVCENGKESTERKQRRMYDDTELPEHFNKYLIISNQKSNLLLQDRNEFPLKSFIESSIFSYNLKKHLVKDNFLAYPCTVSSVKDQKDYILKGVLVATKNNIDDFLEVVKHFEKGSTKVLKINEREGKFVILDADKKDDGGENASVSVYNCIDIHTSDQIFIPPFLENMNYSPVFKHISRVREVIKMCGEDERFTELLSLADKYIDKDVCVDDLQKKIKHPFVVVEGLDAAGKTTLTERLEKLLKATRMFTPPPEITHLRSFYDNQPEIVRRAYYCIGNYIGAFHIAKECQTKPVLMDRFWHSTAAYGLANDCSSNDLPEKGHKIYKWPSDLIKPSLVIFLSVSEEVRKERMDKRAQAQTREEKSLASDQLFRQRLWDSYRRMSDPGVVEIDASSSVESVADEAQKQLSKIWVELNEH